MCSRLPDAADGAAVRDLILAEYDRFLDKVLRRQESIERDVTPESSYGKLKHTD